MLWRTDIHFLSSRGDSRGLYPAFTRCLQPADDLRQLEGSLCAPWLPGFSQHLGSKHWRPTPPTLALCYHCRAWTNTWEAFLSNPLSEQKLKPRQGGPTEPPRRWGRAEPNRAERNRAEPQHYPARGTPGAALWGGRVRARLTPPAANRKLNFRRNWPPAGQTAQSAHRRLTDHPVPESAVKWANRQRAGSLPIGSKSLRNRERRLVVSPIGLRRRSRWMVSGEEGAVSGGGEGILRTDKGGGEAL